jgi:hypothetical protein
MAIESNLKRTKQRLPFPRSDLIIRKSHGKNKYWAI